MAKKDDVKYFLVNKVVGEPLFLSGETMINLLTANDSGNLIAIFATCKFLSNSGIIKENISPEIVSELLGFDLEKTIKTFKELESVGLIGD